MLIERDSIEHDGRVRRAVAALADEGHDIRLLHRGAEDDEPSAREEGATPRSVLRDGPARRTLTRLPATVRRPLGWAAFAWRAARTSADVVHVHDLPMLAPGWIAARASGARLVYDTHEYATDVWHLGWAGRLVARGLERAFVPRCAAVVVPSAPMARQLAERYGLREEPTVVRNVPSPRTFAAGPGAVRDMRAELGIGTAPLLLHQGAAGPGRGVVEVLSALPELPGVHLVQLGDNVPWVRDALTDAARRSGVADRFHQIPSAPLETLLAHTRQADIGVTVLDPTWANHRLTLPNKLFEYLAAELPVVTTAGTATGAAVEAAGAGWTVAFGDRPALIRVLASALEGAGDPVLRGRLARAARDLRTADESAELRRLYRRLRRPPRPAAPAAA